MRISISNLAWDPADDDGVAALLTAQRIDAIDVALGRYFPDPLQATGDAVGRIRDWWRARGVEIVGMQALLFGTTGLNMFAAADVRDRMLAHLAAVCGIAGGLEARRLVFGSPRNRDRTSLDDREVEKIATAFFRQLGDIAAGQGVTICLEPNPVSYGASYMTTSSETAAVVRQVDHPAIRMQFDSGAIAVNREDVRAVVGANADLIAHAHASEPELVPLGERGVDHALAGMVLEEYRPDVVVAIEMLPPRGANRFEVIADAIARAVDSYGSGSRERGPVTAT
jgi:sugar phosphate isomerase/epimerase